MKINKIKSPQLNQNGYHKNLLTKERIGTLFIYPIDFTPDDCLSCDGYSLLIGDFQELYSIIGTKFNQANDEVGTFRVPDYNVSKRFLQPSSNVGIKIEAGLPNITGNFISRGSGVGGCFTSTYNSVGQAFWNNVNNDSYYTKFFNAALSNQIFGNSESVQPPSQTVHICIKYK